MKSSGKYKGAIRAWGDLEYELQRGLAKVYGGYNFTVMGETQVKVWELLLENAAKLWWKLWDQASGRMVVVRGSTEGWKRTVLLRLCPLSDETQVLHWLFSFWSKDLHFYPSSSSASTIKETNLLCWAFTAGQPTVPGMPFKDVGFKLPPGWGCFPSIILQTPASVGTLVLKNC